MTDKKPDLSGTLILVVDDEPEISEMLAEHLQFHGARVYCRKNISEAFELLRNQSFDLVMTDHLMPGGNGLDLIEKIQASGQYGRPATVLISGIGNIPPTDRKVRVDATIGKPFRFKEISEKLTQVLAKFRNSN